MRFSRRDFLSSITALAGVAVLPAQAKQRAASFQQVFQYPPSQAKPWVRWWWPGGVVSGDELRREIQVLNQAGFGGAEIQAFNPAIPKLTKDERTRVHDYANDTFFAHLKICGDAAAERGMRIDSTFGSAWPSGGGFAITPELALLELTPALTSVRAPLNGPIRLNVPGNTRKFGALSALDARNKDPRAQDWRDRLAARQKLVAVVALKGTAPALDNNKNYRSAVVKAAGSVDTPGGIVVTDKLRADGVLDWIPPTDGDWQIVVFKQFAVDSSVMAGVGEGPQLVLDHFNRAAFDAHAQRVGAPLAPGGKPQRGLRATFVDSLELMPDMYWSEDLLAQFQTRRGYDLTPYLPLLLQPGWMEAWNAHASLPYFDAGDIGERIRADYRLTLSELLNENFWKPFIEWNRRHGLSSRVQAHGGPSDLLQSYGMADIPETEDLESGGDTHFMRLARAAANLYGRELVGCESLCWPAKPFEITPAQWQARVNLLFASGVNAIVMHGFPYALHQDAWPGWFPFAPSPFLAGFSSMISEANPLWGAIGTLNSYVTRIQSIMQGGRNVVPVAVYLGEIGYFHGIEPTATTGLLEELLHQGYDYDRINDDCILKGSVSAGCLQTSGGARYCALILPSRAGLRANTAAQLERLASKGLRIFYVDRPPSRDEGNFDRERLDAVTQRAVQATLDAGARIVNAAALAAALRTAGIPANLTFISAPCLFVEKELGGRSAYFLHNPRQEAVNVAFTTRAAGNPELWNAFDGTRTGLKPVRTKGQTEIRLDIGAGAAALIVFTNERLPAASSWIAVDTADVSKRRWTLAVQGHKHAGKPFQQTLTLDRLQDWREIEGLDDLSGQAVYSADVTLDPSWMKPGAGHFLDLGSVHDMASISVNGKHLGTLIAPPFQLDIGKALRAGVNRLAITISNSPNNAMVDSKLPGLKDLKPKPAGLLGPVKIILKRKKVE